MNILKKYAYWEHFVTEAYENNSFPKGITGPRLKKIKRMFFENDFFWDDIISRHGDFEHPMFMDKETYNHCCGNFWTMIAERIP